ncbi:peptidoglycan-binding domain-containing protein [Clostridium tyrobutyricum]|uniref:peptidoglycan-binding domain-containing protein n=1 Tax=Clostridium tyrobutyricum TaxID=1519 RepID=UPI00136294A7|nr:peptidoglycan-binding domain-containing protein [Clostridium tyrobutyricum]
MATILIFSTSVFASGNISNNNQLSQVTKSSISTTSNYDHVVYNLNTGYIEVHYNGYVATANMYSNVVGYGYTTSGQPVKAVQLLLSMHGYSLGIDGLFGNITYNAILSYQRSHSLTSDGIVGKNTWKSLL